MNGFSASADLRSAVTTCTSLQGRRRYAARGRITGHPLIVIANSERQDVLKALAEILLAAATTAQVPASEVVDETR